METVARAPARGNGSAGDVWKRHASSHSFALPSIEPGRYQVHVRVRQGEVEASAATSFQLARADPYGILPGVVARGGTPR